MTKRLLNGVTFNVVETYPKGKKIYVSNKAYTKEAINKTYQVLNEMIFENTKKD